MALRTIDKNRSKIMFHHRFCGVCVCDSVWSKSNFVILGHPCYARLRNLGHICPTSSTQYNRTSYKKIQMTAFWVKSQDQDQNSCQHNIAVKHSMHFENRCVSKNYAVKHYCRALPPDGSHAGFSQGRTLEKVHCSRLTLFHRVIIHCVELEMFMFHQRIRTLCSALILFHGVRPC